MPSLTANQNRGWSAASFVVYSKLPYLSRQFSLSSWGIDQRTDMQGFCDSGPGKFCRWCQDISSSDSALDLITLERMGRRQILVEYADGSRCLFPATEGRWSRLASATLQTTPMMLNLGPFRAGSRGVFVRAVSGGQTVHKDPDLRRQISGKLVPSAQPSSISQPGPTEPAKEPLLPSQPDDSGSQSFSPQRPGSSADISTYESEGNKQQDIVTEEDKPKEGNRLMALAWRIIKGWWQELVCCCLGIASFAVLAVVLQSSDGQPPPDWPLGLTINTAKWAWFKKQPRPLRDFDAFEQASRGIWGSLTLVVRTKGWLLGILAAIVLTSTVATSTITQSAVTYPTRNVDISSDGSAIAWRLDANAPVATEIISNERTVGRGILQGLHMPVTQALPFREPQCRSTNCTWPAFSTLSVCHVTTNVTDLISPSGPYYEVRYDLPNGISTTMVRGREKFSYLPTYFVSLGTPLSHPELNRTRILSYFAINIPDATEVSLYWCVNTYTAKVVGNVLFMNMTSSDGTANSHNNSSELFITPPGGSTFQYKVPVDGNEKIIDLVNRTMTGTSTNSRSGTPETGISGSDMFIQALDDIEADSRDKVNATMNVLDLQKIWWNSAVDGMARNVAAGMTNSLISSSPSTVNGTALRSETYVQVRLPWLALLGAQIVLSLNVLVAIIIETELAGVDVIKSSSLPALLAISAREKAALELCSSEEDSGAGRNDRYLAPNSIDGQFRRKGNRWILDA
ncbi:hypothetical protein Cob_v004038 [Colletotrichum orbiculare MAFF 240422]|uniref:Uncharacterized protein n=1 Tax=Colletotrichum orbiculare (strain 104-T / ATCC 96160 / CBS 514.97 / LARS 414 / MAFF 240422) TaxID=1213857 RepID=A0A484FX13_COLOR|nr:hypothetical protein Cob_v004038 [Colletotrichum orbiculare MAFF 240422]